MRARKFKLLLIEPQGVLTKQCCKTVVPSAEAALGKRRTNAFGARKYDASPSPYP